MAVVRAVVIGGYAWGREKVTGAGPREGGIPVVSSHILPCLV